MRLAAVLALSALVFATPALALDDATAQKLADTLKKKLDDATGEYNSVIKFSAPPAGKVEGDHYVVTYGNASIDTKSGGRMEMPGVVVNLKPTENGLYSYDTKIPTPIKFIDKDGKTEIEITIGSQQITGLADINANVYSIRPQGTAKIDNIVFKDGAGAEVGRIASVTTDMKTTFAPNGKMDQKLDMAINGTAVKDPTDKGALAIESIVFKSEMTGIDAAAYEAMQKKAAEVRAATQKGPGPLTPAEGKALTPQLTDLFSMIAKVGGNGRGVFKVTNLTFTGTDKGQPLSVKLPALLFGGQSVTGANGLYAFNVQYRHDGLEVSPPPNAEVADFLPKTTFVNLQVDNLPLAKLLTLGGEAMATLSTAENPETMQTAVPDYKAKALALLDEAKTTFKVNDIKYVSRVLAGGMTGALVANQQALFGGVGSFDARILGLDELMASLQAKVAAAQQAGTPEAAAEAQSAQSTAMGLTMIQAMGQQVEGTKVSTRTYKFEVGADGSLKVNGADFGGMMTGMNSPHKGRQPMATQ